MPALGWDPLHNFDEMLSRFFGGQPNVVPMDVYRTEDAFCVDLDLPGIDPSEVDVEIDRGSLTVRASRQPRYGTEDSVLSAQRPQGTFTRQIVLAETLDTDAIEAEYRDGVLSLRIPVNRDRRPRKVEIAHRDRPDRLDVPGTDQTPPTGAAPTPGPAEGPR
ncbi:Hsp20/alpha crystallin family protein [Streptoalloteichus hindustanus]|uniref:HSP20 family protein n=1 Tax=Streptoalloteichus hindustanus TaxID=2017 RepID=A0A1M5LC71_STRHI|nr:Hsp20/alpha crystallin family protein [Streptoalloteichus hindustanus]SHG62319.1 HSP20 family protein [Streptoalloteichus hindustanus]